MTAGLAGVVRGDETVGSYNVEAPISAALIDPGSPIVLDWITVSGQPATWNQAFSGPGIIEDGYGNLPTGCTVQSTFGPGVLVNRPGNDLLMLEARFTTGSYAIDVWYDGSWREMTLSASSFISTGLTRSYYYGTPTQGPFPAQVFAAPLDLSVFGLPLGASATDVRFRVVTNGSDPLGLGAIVPEPATLLLLSIGASLLRGTRAVCRRERNTQRAENLGNVEAPV